ncbi:MAG: elongation factor G [Clostridiales bacterium]|nr:elongation factor G [Clostridiales bacterium]
MKLYQAKDIRNVALAGHASKGKTTLAEAMLYIGGASERLGRVTDGNTVLDYDQEEKKRGVSVSAAVAPVEYKNTKINLIDTPGLFDFAQGLSEGLRAAETALLIMSAKSGPGVGTQKAFKLAGKRSMARVFVATKCDGENADFYKTFNEIVTLYGSAVCPVVVPIISGERVAAYYNMIEDKAYRYQDGKASESDAVHDDSDRFSAIRDVFTEAVAGADDQLMEKYFEGEPFTREEKLRGLRQGLADGTVFPVIACAGQTCEGVDQLLDFLCEAAPAPKGEYATDENGEPVELACDENGPLAAVCFKTIADPFIGKLSFFKVISGKITADLPAYNARTGESERMGKVVAMRGGRQEDTAAIPAGDIGAVTKLSGIATGDTLCASSHIVNLDGVAQTGASLSMAINVAKKGDEEKAAAGLLKLCEEDPSLHFGLNKDTKQQILSGLGEQHLDVAVSKLKAKFGVNITLEVPKVAYREAITRKVTAQGRHKKQSGGHGQFGDVFIEFEPCDSDGLEFAERVVGGAVPKGYFPAVEKGLKECMQKGVLAGYPMAGLKATLFDGSYHPVDSSEMSFKMAAALAYKNGIPNAGPVILEPIGTLKAVIADDSMGDIIGDVNKRRGRVLGMNSVEDGMQEVVAEVPMAEMSDFSTAMRQITQGRGSYTLVFERYEKAPEHIAQKIMEEAAQDA